MLIFKTKKLKKKNKKKPHPHFNHYYTFLSGNSVEKLNKDEPIRSYFISAPIFMFSFFFFGFFWFSLVFFACGWDR